MILSVGHLIRPEACVICHVQVVYHEFITSLWCNSDVHFCDVILDLLGIKDAGNCGSRFRDTCTVSEQ